MNPTTFRKIGKPLIWFVLTLSILSIHTGCNGEEGDDRNMDDTLSGPVIDPDTLEKEPADDWKTYERRDEFTDNAKLLAGMAVDGGSEYSKYMEDPSWKEHAGFFKNNWVKVEEEKLPKLQEFREKELRHLEQVSEDVFYPFSGADFLHVKTFFPSAKRYVLTGLEPVGDIPDLRELPEKQFRPALRGINAAIEDILRWSFFRTKGMEIDFKQNPLKGVIPVLSVFMVRTGHQLLDISYVGIDSSGMAVTVPAEQRDSLWAKLLPGVRYKFRSEGDDVVRELYYFSVDLSDNKLKETPEYNTFVKRLHGPVTYLKSASYLMHKDYFSNIRDLILNQSRLVLQDDSGIPVRFFKEPEWKVIVYGTYDKPIPLFANWYQAELIKLYQRKDSNLVRPLDFGIGYDYQKGTSNLILAYKPEFMPTPEDSMYYGLKPKLEVKKGK